MRLFRSSKEKKSGGSDSSDSRSQSSHSRSEESPHKSIFKSMGSMFLRSPKRNNEHHHSRLDTPSITRILSEEIIGTSKQERRGWFSKLSDSSSMKCDTLTSKSFDSGSPNSPDSLQLNTSGSNLSLSPLSLKASDDNQEVYPLDLKDVRSLNAQWDSVREDRPQRTESKDTLFFNDEHLEMGNKYNELLSPPGSDFEVKHAIGINRSHNITFDSNIWFYEEDVNKEQKRVVKERNFFNIRNKLSNAHKGSQSKGFKFMGQKGQKGSSAKAEIKSQEVQESQTVSPKVHTSITSNEHKVIHLTNHPTVENISYEVDEENNKKIEEIFSLPLLQDTQPINRPELFQKKLIACQTVVDFDDKKKLNKAIELKRQILLEIIDYISTTRNCINERILQDVIDMLSANVFRTLPQTTKNPKLMEIEEIEPTLEKSWPHLQIVYDVFLRVIVSNDVTSKMARNAIDKTFVLKLLATLNSEDQRERDYLKTIIHRIYGKIVPLRNFIRKAIENTFIHFVYDTEVYYGINELLEILGSIINGFAIPLKEEHKLYMRKALMPLHKPNSLKVYHLALTYCLVQYINKDRSLAATILTWILNYWPTKNAQKELLFLYELEEVLSLTELPEFNSVINPLIKRLKQCITSTHFQVAERTLYMWNNERIVRMFNMTKNTIYPALVPVLEDNSNNHWNVAVRSLAFNICKLLNEGDPILYNRCIEMASQNQMSQERRELWEKLESSIMNEDHRENITLVN